jgi:uncharacterized membrane protein YdbT with pleckstrin-like domain
MKMIFASIFTTLLIVAMTLGAMALLVSMTKYAATLHSPAQWLVAVIGELVMGIVLLLGTVWLATHLAVRIFSTKETSPDGGPLA